MKKDWGIEEESIGRDSRDGFVIAYGDEIGWWKIAEAEEGIVGVHCRGGYMNN